MPSAAPRLKTRDVRVSALVDAEPLAVYRALTSARELTRWWLAGAETDARNCGRVRMVWPPSRGAAVRLGEREGQFVDLEPGRKVAWLFKPARGEKDKVPPLVSVFINPGRRGCELTWLHSGFAAGAEALRAAYARGWEDGLAKLKLYLETGRSCKLETLDLESVRVLGKERR